MATAPIALIGVGMTIVIITGGIDVSVGGAIMVCSVLTAKQLVAGLSAPVAVLLAIAVGGVLGLVNGLLIAYGRVHAIIITFGTANLFLFLGLQLFGSRTVNGIPPTFEIFGRGDEGRTLGVPHAFAITVLITALAWWYLRHTAGGRHFYAIGGDAHAARLAGVRVQRRVLLAYLLTGAAGRARLLLRDRPGHLDARPVRRRRQGARGDRRRGDRRHVDHGRPRLGARDAAGGAARAVRHLRGHPARLELAAVGPVRGRLHRRGGRHRPAARPYSEDAMTTTSAPPTKTPDDTTQEGLGARALRALLTQRIALLAVLIVVVVVWFFVLDAGGYLTASYNFDYMSASLINAVPLAMLGLAELLVILSGRGGIDLSVGAIVSLSGMVFGFAYGEWGWPLWLAIVVTALSGALLGAVNGFLVAYVGFPALIATLATFYAYKSLAIVINDQSPISTPPIQQLFSITRSVELPLFGQYVPDVPLGLFTFLLPTVVVVWVLLARTTYGRRLYGIGTNDVAARWAGLPVRGTRFKAYTYAGLISGFVAVVTVAQFASARPDAGVSGNGMALPAITIAVLGGVAITGGIGRVAGVVLATLLIVWLNAGILLAFVGNEGSQYQLLALGAVLVFAALLNGLTTRRYGGTR